MVDFWRLVWQERPPTIVMLTDVKEKKKVKCYKYWPDSGTRSFGPFRVTITEQQRLVDYTTRNLLLEVWVLHLFICYISLCNTLLVYMKLFQGNTQPTTQDELCALSKPKNLIVPAI